MSTTSVFAKTLSLPPLTALLLSAAVFFPPAASALPQCENLSPLTTQCETRGSTQIYTTPAPRSFGTWPGWTWGYGWGGPGFVIGFG